MLTFSVVIFVFSTLTLSLRPPLSRKVGGHDTPAPMGAPPLEIWTIGDCWVENFTGRMTFLSPSIA